MKTQPAVKTLGRRLLLPSLISLIATATQAAEMVTVKILVSNIDSNAGQLIASAYSADNWLDSNPPLRTVLPLADRDLSQPVVLTMEVPAGDHAFAVFHDEDGNGKMNTNFIGLPNEPVGLSNKHRPRFGPPRYKKAKLSIDQANADVPIRLD